MFLLVACQHASGMCHSHFCSILSLHEAPRKYIELSPSTPPFLTLQFREKDLTPTPNLPQIRPIPPPLGRILSNSSKVPRKEKCFNYVKHIGFPFVDCFMLKTFYCWYVTNIEKACEVLAKLLESTHSTNSLR